MNILTDEESLTLNGNVVCKFTTGQAGTGKTFQFKRRIEADAKEGILCATTGVAAVKLGTTTLHSTLGYFDTDSLADSFATGKLRSRLISLRKRYGYKSLMIDEASMLEKYALDLITEAAKQANGLMANDGLAIQIELTGDFAQLPPVSGEWAFKSANWPLYAENMVKLDKVYRQTDLNFLEALRQARQGNGKEASEQLRSIAKFSLGLDLDFNGTTIVDKNKKVDDVNTLRYLKLTGPEYAYHNTRWGKQRSEWKQIPDVLALKDKTLVMILNNGYVIDSETDTRRLDFANGDSGTIVELLDGGARVKLFRTEQDVFVPYVTRQFESKDEPTKFDDPRSYYSEIRKRYILGEITYLPVRLAYAVTVHKSQGLTLDRVQLDPRGHFFGSFNMAYVALSRVKDGRNLKIVGTPEMLARRINVHPEIGEWI